MIEKSGTGEFSMADNVPVRENLVRSLVVLVVLKEQTRELDEKLKLSKNLVSS